MELNSRARAIELNLTQLELQPAPEITVADIDEGLQAFVREVVLTSNNPKKVREFLAGFIQEVVLTETEAKISYRKDRLVMANATETVHSKKGWLPDQGSNLGPAD